jgi:hypothetical protein
MEAGGLGHLEEACECQLQAAMHPTYVAALNTRHQSVIGIRDVLVQMRIRGLRILTRGSVLRVTDSDPALF